jgi:hypothetical protein
MSKNTPTFLTNKDIEKLSEDPRNQVYRYENDNPTQTFTTQQQRVYITEIRKRYLELRATHEEWSDEVIRQNICKSNKILNSFAENNTKIFELFTCRDTTDDSMNHIQYMLYLKDQKDKGLLTESSAQEEIQKYLITQFKTDMTLEQYKEQMAKEKQEKKKKNKK